MTGGTSEKTINWSSIIINQQQPIQLELLKSNSLRGTPTMTLYITPLTSQPNGGFKSFALPGSFSWQTKSDFMSYFDNGNCVTTYCNFVTVLHHIVHSSSLGKRSSFPKDTWLYFQEQTTESYPRTYCVTENYARPFLFRKSFQVMSHTLKKALGNNDEYGKGISTLYKKAKSTKSKQSS